MAVGMPTAATVLLGQVPLAVATDNHTSECEGALHKVLSEWLKLTHTLRCLPQVAKVTIAVTVTLRINSVVYIHCVHTCTDVSMYRTNISISSKVV